MRLARHHNPIARVKSSQSWWSALGACVVCAALVLLATSCSRPKPMQSGGPRIVALSPAVAVILQRLGHERLIVGRHAYDLSLPKGIPIAGDQAGIDYESLISLQPTHVLTQWGSRELPERLRTLASEKGWTLYDAPLLALDDIPAATAHIDRLISLATSGNDSSSAGRELIAKMTTAWAVRGDFKKAGRVLLLASIDPPAALGPGSFHHQILTRIGGTPAIMSGAAYIELDREDIRAINPDVIVLIRPASSPGAATRISGSSQADTTEALAVIAPIADLPIRAAQNRRVHLITDPLALTPSPSMIEFADELARILAEWSK